MVYCTDVKTTAQLLNLSIWAIYQRIRRNQIQFISFHGGYLIPLAEIARELKKSEKNLLRRMRQKGLPVWGCD